MNFSDEITDLELTHHSPGAASLRDRMLEARWEDLSVRDSIEFFNELLRLDEELPRLLDERADVVPRRLRGDVRTGHRQDQISKAHILCNLSIQATVSDLTALVRESYQDLDTRNMAARILWRRSDAAVAFSRGRLASFVALGPK